MRTSPTSRARKFVAPWIAALMVALSLVVTRQHDVRCAATSVRPTLGKHRPRSARSTTPSRRPAPRGSRLLLRRGRATDEQHDLRHGEPALQSVHDEVLVVTTRARQRCSHYSLVTDDDVSTVRAPAARGFALQDARTRGSDPWAGTSHFDTASCHTGNRSWTHRAHVPDPEGPQELATSSGTRCEAGTVRRPSRSAHGGLRLPTTPEGPWSKGHPKRTSRPATAQPDCARPDTVPTDAAGHPDDVRTPDCASTPVDNVYDPVRTGPGDAEGVWVPGDANGERRAHVSTRPVTDRECPPRSREEGLRLQVRRAPRVSTSGCRPARTRSRSRSTASRTTSGTASCPAGSPTPTTGRTSSATSRWCRSRVPRTARGARGRCPRRSPATPVVRTTRSG